MEDWHSTDPISLIRLQQEKIGRLEACLDEYGRLNHRFEDKIGKHERKHTELEVRVHAGEMQLREQQEKLAHQKASLELHIAELRNESERKEWEPKEEPCNDGPVTRFRMENVENICRGGITWKSHPVFTHVHGYKLYVAVKVHKSSVMGKKSLKIGVFAIAGEHDDKLKWPARCFLSLELIRKDGRPENLMVMSGNCVWNLPMDKAPLVFQNAGSVGQSQALVDLKQLKGFVCDDRLEFKLSKTLLL